MGMTRTLWAASFVAMTIAAWAADNDKNKTNLNRARDTVDRIRQPDPPRVSSGTTNAADIARRENDRERQRQAERSTRLQLDKHNVPPPGR